MRGLYVGSVIMVMQVIACAVAGGGVAKTSGDLCAIKILFMKRIPAVHGDTIEQLGRIEEDQIRIMIIMIIKNKLRPDQMRTFCRWPPLEFSSFLGLQKTLTEGFLTTRTGPRCSTRKPSPPPIKIGTDP